MSSSVLLSHRASSILYAKDKDTYWHMTLVTPSEAKHYRYRKTDCPNRQDAINRAMLHAPMGPVQWWGALW